MNKNTVEELLDSGFSSKITQSIQNTNILAEDSIFVKNTDTEQNCNNTTQKKNIQKKQKYKNKKQDKSCTITERTQTKCRARDFKLCVQK